jgi:hypothetical protein
VIEIFEVSSQLAGFPHPELLERRKPVATFVALVKTIEPLHCDASINPAMPSKQRKILDSMQKIPPRHRYLIPGRGTTLKLCLAGLLPQTA